MEFVDNADITKISESLKECKTIEEIKEYINDTMPGWITSYHSTYSMDYPFLISNFTQICQKYKTTPKGLVLVKYIPGEGDLVCNYRTLTKFLDVMAANGFCVRRDCEFFPCKKCDSLIPKRALYSKLKFVSPNGVPSTWRNTCEKCK